MSFLLSVFRCLLRSFLFVVFQEVGGRDDTLNVKINKDNTKINILLFVKSHNFFDTLRMVLFWDY